MLKIPSYNNNYLSRGDSHMTGAGMLVISLRGANHEFWSDLRC